MSYEALNEKSWRHGLQGLGMEWIPALEPNVSSCESTTLRPGSVEPPVWLKGCATPFVLESVTNASSNTTVGFLGLNPELTLKTLEGP